MSISYNRIAYEALEVCNGVTLQAIEGAVARTGLQPGARATDVGTGNATVAIRLAQAFGLATTAIEYDPVMAELAANRIAQSGAAVELVVGAAAAAARRDVRRLLATGWGISFQVPHPPTHPHTPPQPTAGDGNCCSGSAC